MSMICGGVSAAAAVTRPAGPEGAAGKIPSSDAVPVRRRAETSTRRSRFALRAARGPARELWITSARRLSAPGPQRGHTASHEGVVRRRPRLACFGVPIPPSPRYELKLTGPCHAPPAYQPSQRVEPAPCQKTIWVEPSGVTAALGADVSGPVPPKAPVVQSTGPFHEPAYHDSMRCPPAPW